MAILALAALPCGLAALACFLVYRAILVRIGRATINRMEGIVLVCVVSVVFVPACIGFATFFSLNVAYTNFPDLRPQSWDIAMIYTAFFFWACALLASIVGSGVVSWKLYREGRA